jgi:hypothetical protein
LAGGSGGFGSTRGPNDGVTFSTLALAEGDATTSRPGSNFLNQPLAPYALISLFGNFTMNDTDGMTSGFSFYYSSNGAFPGATIDIYSGLNGTGSLLASMNPNAALTPFCTTSEQFCVWQADGATFSGTVESVVFKNVDYTAFDDVTWAVAPRMAARPRLLLPHGNHRAFSFALWASWVCCPSGVSSQRGSSRPTAIVVRKRANQATGSPFSASPGEPVQAGSRPSLLVRGAPVVKE